MVAAVMRTVDGEWWIYIRSDQTAELCDRQRRLVLGPAALYKIGRRLAELDISSSDLVPG